MLKISDGPFSTMEYPLLQKLDLTNVSVYSFDVFDTVLTRLVCSPLVVFALAARQAQVALPGSCSPGDFATLRACADRRAHRWHGDTTTLNDIYRELQASLNLSDSATEHIKAAELTIEQRVLYPVPCIQTVLQALREREIDIAFTSDMYLPSEFIRKRLIEHDVWQDGDRLFVSCEHGQRKPGGDLFASVLQAMQCHAHQTVHVGNCESSDVNGARLAGLRAVHLGAGNPNRYERILANHAFNTAELTGCMAGASRYARLHTEITSSYERELRDVAAGVIAPILTGFVLWILHNVQNQGLERLYFTSRDGHALVPIARRLADALDINCTFKYLYLSRAALTAANPDSGILYRMLQSEEIGAEAVLSRYGLDFKAIRPYLPTESAYQQVKTRPLTAEGKRLISTAISKLGDNAQNVDSLTQNRELLHRYLRQEGLHGEGPIGFVDIGWKGSIHSMLSDFLQQESIRTRPLPAFLFGLSTPQQPYATNRTAYFFDSFRKIGQKGILQPDMAIFKIMEIFCTADHGTVTGYRKENGHVVPTLAPGWTEQVTAWGLPVVRRTLTAFVDGLAEHPTTLSREIDPRHALRELLQRFWHGPSTAEADAWGSFPREIGQAHESAATRPLAPPHRWPAILSFALHGPCAPKHIHDGFYWHQGSYARSSPALQSCITLTLRVRRRLKRLARRIKTHIPF